MPSGEAVPKAGPPQDGAAPSSTGEAGPEAEHPGSTAGREAERRQVTVMSVDLVGSTALATRLDPEELQGILEAYQAAVARAVGHFEGHVIQLVGDGAFACFGWPLAHEDDAERGVRAALATVEAVSRIPVPGAGALACRAGVATGLVVAGDMAVRGDGAVVVGEAPHLATRLQAVAEPGTVVVAESTRRLLGELFALESRGLLSLKGFARPVQAWRILGEGRAQGRFEALRGTDLMPLVGRRQELAVLLDRWDRARQGKGQAVLLSGQAGIGKSRLVRELRARIAVEPYTPLVLSCSPYHANTVLYPVARLLERAARLDRAVSPEQALDQLEALLTLAQDRVAEPAQLLAGLLEIPDVGRYPALDLSPRQKKERTLEALLGQLAGLAARKPVLLFYDDAHWADPTTLELLDRVVERVQPMRVLVAVTSRLGFVPPWSGRGHVTLLSLGRLERREGAAMVRQVAGGATVSTEALDGILDRADGVPLFLEELTRAALVSGAAGDHGPHDELAGASAVPATLKDSLMAQLDQLSVVRQVAQVAAVIGRTFSHELLAAVAAVPEADLRHGLDQLVEAGLLYRTVDRGSEAYAFRHTLLRDAAYESLLRRRRRELHARVATALEQAFPLVSTGKPELLAHHLTEAGLAGQAIGYWRQAAERAVERYANAEAEGHFRQALRLLRELPAGPERDRTELLLRLGLGVPLLASKGYSAAEVHETYGRARELCRGKANAPVMFPVLFGLCVSHLVKADLPVSRSLAAQCLAAAREAGDEELLLEACGLSGMASMYGGRLIAARAFLERGLALYRSQSHALHTPRYGQDPMTLLAFVARVHALLGDQELARRRAEDLLAATQAPATQPNSLAALHAHLALTHLLFRDGMAARRHAEAVIAVAAQQELRLWLGLGRMYRGAAQVELGLSGDDPASIARGLADGLEGLAAYRATGAGLDVPTCLCWFAAGHVRLGQPVSGLQLLDEARRIMAESGESYFAAEVHRLTGDLSLLREAPDFVAAEASLREGLAIARRQRARLLELRVRGSLARLRCAQGRHEQGRDLQGAIYGH